jgi:crossover junction endodeoxyribonuclease RusA
MLVLTLPFPPSVNTYWRNIGRGRTIISKRGRQYRDDVVGHVAAHPKADMLADRLHVAITLHPPDNRRRDVDNYLKAPLDALTHAGVWADDLGQLTRGPERVVDDQIDDPGGDRVLLVQRLELLARQPPAAREHDPAMLVAHAPER